MSRLSISKARTDRFGPNAAAVDRLTAQLRSSDLLTYRLLSHPLSGLSQWRRDGARNSALTAARAGARSGAVCAARDVASEALRAADVAGTEWAHATVQDAVLGTVVRDLISDATRAVLLEPWQLVHRVRNELSAAGHAVEIAATCALEDRLDIPLEALPALCRSVVAVAPDAASPRVTRPRRGSPIARWKMR